MEMHIGCDPDWVKSSKMINSLATLCKMWWTIANNLTLIMDMLFHYNICTKTKCISFLTDFLVEGFENTFGYLDKFSAPNPTMLIFSSGQALGTLDNLDNPQ